MKKNQGFSFVELLLCISIIAIMTGAATLSIGLIARGNVNRAVKKIDSSISEACTLAMAKGSVNGKLRIFYENNKIFCYVGNTGNADNIEENKKEVARDPVQIKFYLKDGSDIVLSDSDSNVEFSFDSSSGSFRKMDIDGGTPQYCDRVEVFTEKSSVSIVLYPSTGKHVIE